MGNNRLYLKLFVNIIVYILTFIFCVFFLPKLIRFFLPFVIGWIIAIIANPFVRFMEKKVKIVRKHSSAIIIILVLAAVVGALYGIIYFTYIQVSSLVKDIPNIVTDAQNQLLAMSERLNHLYVRLPVSVQKVVDNIVEEVQNYFTNFKLNGNKPMISSAGNLARNVVEFALMFIITIISSYFFIAERDNMINRVKQYLPESIQEKYRIIISNFKTAFGGYIKAQFKIMLVLLGIIFISLEIMKINYSFLLALGIAFLDFLPFFGTGAVYWPWAVIELISGNYPRVIMLLVTYLVCQIVRQVLQPKMVGDSIGMNPLATLIFMFIGYRFYGVLGMILGVPIGMVLIKFYQIGAFDNMIKGVNLLVTHINEFRKF